MKKLTTIPIITKKPAQCKYKIVFENSDTVIQPADTYTEAVILSMANRIRGKKPQKIVGMWCKQNENTNWEHVAQNHVTIAI